MHAALRGTDGTLGGAAAAVAAKLTGGRAKSDNSDEASVLQMMEEATGVDLDGEAARALRFMVLTFGIVPVSRRGVVPFPRPPFDGTTHHSVPL